MSSVSAVAQQKIAVVDLQKVFDGYYKTQEQDKALKERGQEFDRTLKEMIDRRQTKIDEVDRARKEAANIALSEAKRTQLAELADQKLKELQTMEGNIQTFNRTAQKTLGELQVQAREQIIKELQVVIREIAKSKGYDLVLDAVARSKNDTPIILFSNGRDDITEETIRIANQTRPTGSVSPNGIIPK